ncbi:microtubule nucleation factor SSNA1-like [Rhineura floridana]|uniref:microtubule nucleation factor SSNA1-like n=1 Tax=Rhineura floridana TaxID=261503 RepID=UPI002AC86477|nr:microtubule nucleation factor SSNA1-like [Rhineura floridana]
MIRGSRCLARIVTTKLFWEARGRPQVYSRSGEEQLPAARRQGRALRLGGISPTDYKIQEVNGDNSQWKKGAFPPPPKGEASRMTHQGAVLQGYNNELVKCIEDLCMQREELNKQIVEAEEEKNKIQDEVEMLTKQLDCVCESLAWKNATQKKLDELLAETQLAYEKILESSRMLLNVLKTEMGNLDKIVVLNSNVTGAIQMFGLQQTQH